MKINNFRGDIIDVSAKKEALVGVIKPMFLSSAYG